MSGQGRKKHMPAPQPPNNRIPPMNNQLALAIQRHDEATFEDYCWGDNKQLKKELDATLSGTGERFIYLWGAPGSGKSHLLQACCQQLAPLKKSIYLPLDILKTWDPTSLGELEPHHLFCIDALDAIVSMPEWEEALFHLYNRIRDNTNEPLLIMANRSAPRHTNMTLPDLQSRLSSGLIMHIQPLSDADKAHTLSLAALRRGFELSSSAAQFLVHRSARNMHDLHLLLEKLDHASLVAQRKITIPFIKSTFNW